MWGALKEVRSAWSDFFCTHCDRLSSFVVSPFAVFYRICGFSVRRGPFRCCGRIYSFGQRILIFVRCQYWFSSKNLRNLFCNTPWCCDVLQNIFYLCRVVACDMTYFDESVSLLSLTGNLVNMPKELIIFLKYSVFHFLNATIWPRSFIKKWKKLQRR